MELNEKQVARINRGAALLDAQIPDWFTRVNMQILDVNSFHCCVLCQATQSSFWDGCDALGLLPTQPEGGDFVAPSEHGFYPHADEKYGSDEDEDSDEYSQKEYKRAEEISRLKTAYWNTLIIRRLEGVK